MQAQSLGLEVPLEEDMTTHFSILAWRIPWTEDLGGLWSKGSQRVKHDKQLSTQHTHDNSNNIKSEYGIKL